MFKKIPALFSILLLVAFSHAGLANNPDPNTLLESITEQLLSALEKEQEAIQARPEQLFEVVERHLVPHVDMVRMSGWVLGKNWRKASKEQKTRFTREFQTLLVRFYVSALLEDPSKIDELLARADNLISFMPATFNKDQTQSLVKAEVHIKKGLDVPVSFRMYNKEDGWKLIDVTVDGISLVTNYRSSFATEIRRDGLDSVIEQMANRNQNLLNDAVKKGTTVANES